jgi:hypothetical protein
MGGRATFLIVTALLGAVLPGLATAQKADAGPVQVAAQKFASGVAWRESTVLIADFNCTGNVQHAILGASAHEIVVAIFTAGLGQSPALLRFEANLHDIRAAKIRLDDYTLSAEEITGVSGTAPVGYRPSANCHGVRLSDDSSEAAHIYWDHEHRRFDSWTQ